MPPKRQGKYLVKRNPKKTTKQRYKNTVTLVRPLPSPERKWKQVGTTYYSINPGSVYALNPFYWIAQGTQQDQRVGLILQNVNLYVDIQYSHVGSTNVAVSKSYNSSVRGILLASPAQWHQAVEYQPEVNTAGLGTVINTTDVFLDSNYYATTTSYLNKDRVKILKDSGCKMVNQQLATDINHQNGASTHFRMKYKVGDLRYQANGSQSYLRDDNVYLWITASFMGQQTPVVNDFAGVFTCRYLITWEDS